MWVALCFAGTAAAAEIKPLDLLPPLPEWHGASESLIAPAEHPWITPAEASGLEETPDYEATLGWLRRLDEASPRIALRSFGRSAGGRELIVVIASRQPVANAAGLRANGRPTFLAQAGIHAGEIDGKDAGLMLLRDLAFGAKAELLERANFLLIPFLNADGHERRSPFNRPNQRGPRVQGWRTNAQNLNLNRDYAKLDSPEVRSLISLIREWQPDLYYDLHVTDGYDHQYDITFGSHEGTRKYSPAIERWLSSRLMPATYAALRSSGHVPGVYADPVNGRDLEEGLKSGAPAARFSAGYGDRTHLPAVLVETHSLKDYRRRVLGTYVTLEAALRTLGSEGGALRKAIARDRASRPRTVPMTWVSDAPLSTSEFDPRDTSQAPMREIDFLGVEYDHYDSPASGTREVRWLGRPKTFKVRLYGDKPVLEITRPKAYWVPGSETGVIERLRLHGVDMEVLEADRTVRVEMFRLVGPKPATSSFEGRFPLVTSVRAELRQETFRAGSVRVSTDQVLGDWAMTLLEPRSDDSFLAWGFFPHVLQRTEYMENYVLAPLADRMLAADPRLKLEFDARVKADPAFAGDAQARLNWFYERTPFLDPAYLLYPIGREP